MDWVDKFSRKYPDLHIWKKSQVNFIELAEVQGHNDSEKFEDKY
jgi:hypothetical protein